MQMKRRSRSPERDRAISEFVERFAPCDNKDLLEEMIITICRLAKDGCGRGELKILNSSLKELRYGFKIFAPYQHIHKVSIFGSSRTPQGHPEYNQARKFAEQMEREGWMVITGAGDGIMRAGHHGASRESSFGVAISLPFEQETNPIIADDEKLVNFKYFFTRKLMFVKEAHAIVLFPGGFGTQDEGFEALTLVQTGKSQPVPIVMLEAPGGNYWHYWKTHVEKNLLDTGMISAEDMNLFLLTDDADVAVHELVQFYKRYHSSRFVKDDMVLRLNEPLPDDFVEDLNRQYKQIVVSGRIEQHAGPIEGEFDEEPDKTRLVFHYDKQSSGTLRRMINAINDL